MTQQVFLRRELNSGGKSNSDSDVSVPKFPTGPVLQAKVENEGENGGNSTGTGGSDWISSAFERQNAPKPKISSRQNQKTKPKPRPRTQLRPKSKPKTEQQSKSSPVPPSKPSVNVRATSNQQHRRDNPKTYSHIGNENYQSRQSRPSSKPQSQTSGQASAGDYTNKKNKVPLRRKMDLKEIIRGLGRAAWDNSRGGKNDDSEMKYDKAFFEKQYREAAKVGRRRGREMPNPSQSETPKYSPRVTPRPEDQDEAPLPNPDKHLQGDKKNDKKINFQLPSEREERVRNNRLRSNRAALGLDGPPKSKHNPNNPFMSNEPFKHDFSDDILEKELKRLAEKRERMLQGNAEVDKYEKRWNTFVELTNGCRLVKKADVPFLPTFDCNPFQAKASKRNEDDWRIVGFGVNDKSSYSAKKAALRKATMRYHPDQFFNKYAARIDPCEVDSIMQGVKECSQRLNEMRRRLVAEKEKDFLSDLEKTNEFDFTKKSKEK